MFHRTLKDRRPSTKPILSTICLQTNCTCHFHRLENCIKKKANDEAKSILELFKDPRDTVKKLGPILLHCAVRYSNIVMIQHFIDLGCNVNAEDSNGLTPLLQAITMKDVISVAVLLKNNAKVFSTGGGGALSKNKQVLEFLILKTTSAKVPRRLDLGYLLKDGTPETVKSVLECGIDFTTMKFSDGQCVLHLLLENENHAVFEKLDEHNVILNVNSRDSNGLTPLMKAAKSGSVDALKFLLRSGCDVNLTTSKGESALYYGASYCIKLIHPKFIQEEMIKMLLRHGANAQNVCYDKSIFDICRADQQGYTASLILAHLALDKVSDRFSLTDRTKREIGFVPIFKSYFDGCIKQLEQMENTEVYDNVSLFELLYEKNITKIARYIRNKKLRSALESTLKRKFYIEEFYMETLQEKVLMINERIKFEDKIAPVIEALTGICSDAYHHVVYQIITYLDHRDLKQLCRV